MAEKRYKLVHAAPVELWETNEDRRYLTPTHFAVWRRLEADAPLPDGYTLIFGHTPTCHFREGAPMEVWYGENRIGIDCGCGYPGTGVGRLACLRLEDGRVFYSE